MNGDFLDNKRLRNFSIFQDLPDEALESIKSRIMVVRFARGETIITHEARDTDVFLLLEGQALVNRYSLAGREISYRRLPANSYMGELAVFDGRPRSVNVIAVTEVVMGRLSGAAFTELILTIPEVMKALLCDLSARIRDLSDRIYENTASSVKMRFYTELMRTALAEQGDEDEIVLRDPPTHADWAAIVGGQRESITRALGELTALGILRKQGRNLVVTDLDRLIDQIEEA
jgi:CRP-like cAMP-binding protein